MISSKSNFITLALDAQGEVYVLQSGDAFFAESCLDEEVHERIQSAFLKDTGAGLLHLGVQEIQTSLPPVLSFWREFAKRFCILLAQNPETEVLKAEIRIEFPENECEAILNSAPPMLGGEYLNENMLHYLWELLHQSFAQTIANHQGTVSSWFEKNNELWHCVGRVCFHLAENKDDSDFPFAFLATYSTQISKNGKVSYKPLGIAIEENAKKGNRNLLVKLLEPVYRASKAATFLNTLVNNNSIFQTLFWNPQEAYSFLKEIHIYEEAGVMVRVPSWWQPIPRRAKARATIGDKNAGLFSAANQLSFQVDVSCDGEILTQDEIEKILRGVDGLVLIKGKWVEVDKIALQKALNSWKQLEEEASNSGLSFIQAMRALAGLHDSKNAQNEVDDNEDNDWAQFVTGKELTAILQKLRNPELIDTFDLSHKLKAKLRTYQIHGMNWLCFLNSLEIGACLADDMGLGKTIQVISLFLKLAHESKKCHLVITPASLISNWCSEFAKFAPSLRIFVAHASQNHAAELKQITQKSLLEYNVVISTYGAVLKLPWLSELAWDTLVLDEAQAIKNPDAKQTRAIKSIRSRARIAVTGTPVENRLTDLWSIFDFLNPGLLGTKHFFDNFMRRIKNDNSKQEIKALRKLVAPYILRRMKTDKRIISDLPDKVEMKIMCGLSKKQIALYQDSCKEFAQKLSDDKFTGIEKKGLVLKYLLRLKQICNHPSQWLDDHSWNEKDSGKFKELRQIAEVVASRQEKMLVFSQFRETLENIVQFLEQIFGRKGLLLHGATPIATRQQLVESFSNPHDAPFFVLSLKAGGTGLNLTAANHVVHFDRWWNPAVENQATDRVFRIGQKRNVMIHKFVTQGTLEDNIDMLIEHKKALAGEVFSGNDEVTLTELSDQEIIKLVSLDLNKVSFDI